ncbi:MAG: DUF115 domain-containing protein [Promethearchaeota archaeon]
MFLNFVEHVIPPEVINFRAFGPFYDLVLSKFGYDPILDAKARDLLDGFISTDPREVLTRMARTCAGKTPLVFGAAPSLEKDGRAALEGLGDRTLGERFVTCAADGAARLFLELDKRVDLAFTDLDGLTGPQLENLRSRGTILVVHAHGDNVSLIREREKLIREGSASNQLLGTTQAPPTKKVINPGGFTDGDRAVCFVHHFLPRARYYLFGMDFGGEVGRYSKPGLASSSKPSETKRTKLDLGLGILEWLVKVRGVEAVAVGVGPPSEVVRTIATEEFLSSVAGR